MSQNLVEYKIAFILLLMQFIIAQMFLMVLDMHSDDSNHGMYIPISDRNIMAVAKLIYLV